MRKTSEDNTQQRGNDMNRSEIEIQAIVKGVNQKELLDFFDTFEQITGYVIDSPFIDQKYLDENGTSTSIVLRSLLSQKLPKESVDKLIDIFETVANINK